MSSNLKMRLLITIGFLCTPLIVILFTAMIIIEVLLGIVSILFIPVWIITGVNPIFKLYKKVENIKDNF